MRKYKTGSRWAFWRWSHTDSGYLTRLHLIMTPWFAICLHWINHPDVEPWLHDHPVSFFSLVLRGGYGEWRETVYAHEAERTYKMHRWFNFVRATENDRHKIVHVKPKTLTLCFMTSVRRKWGFHTPNGWVYWKDYYNEQVSIGPGMFFITRKDFYKAVREGRVRFEHEVLPPTRWDDIKLN